MPSARKIRPSAEGRAHEDHLAGVLRSAGWRLGPKGWTHPHLAYPWPLLDAMRLQVEADDGRQDLVCMSLREEVWPA